MEPLFCRVFFIVCYKEDPFISFAQGILTVLLTSLILLKRLHNCELSPLSFALHSMLSRPLFFRNISIFWFFFKKTKNWRKKTRIKRCSCFFFGLRRYFYPYLICVTRWLLCFYIVEWLCVCVPCPLFPKLFSKMSVQQQFACTLIHRINAVCCWCRFLSNQDATIWRKQYAWEFVYIVYLTTVK